MKRFLFVLPVTLLLVATACNSSSTTPQAQTTTTSTQQPVAQNPIPTPTVVNSLTYTDNTWGFAFRYPKNYSAINSNIKTSAKFGTATLVRVYNSANKSIEFGPELDINVIRQPYAADGKIYKDIYSFAAVYFQLGQYDDRVKTKIDGHDAFQMDKPTDSPYIKGGPVNSGKEFMILKDGLIYHITYSPKDYPGFSSIVNSFKFTK